MEDMSGLMGVASPTTSLGYVYGEEQYLEATSSFDSPSGGNSPYDVSAYSPDLSLSGSSGSQDGEEEEATVTSSSQGKPAPKRKRENRYKNAPPSVLSRRRAQNRASQRAYRERKDQRIKDLETMLNDAKSRNEVLTQAYASLHAEYVQLKASELKEQAYHADLGFDSSNAMPSNVNMDDFFAYDMSNTYNV